MTDTKIEWGAPPSKRGGRTVFTREVLAGLTSKPGEWACIKRNHPNASVLTGFMHRNPDFEGTTRLQADGTFDLYARYVGSREPKQAEPVEGPHSRACGTRPHHHGPLCHSNCPTCGGKP